MKIVYSNVLKYGCYTPTLTMKYSLAENCLKYAFLIMHGM